MDKRQACSRKARSSEWYHRAQLGRRHFLDLHWWLLADDLVVIQAHFMLFALQRQVFSCGYLCIAPVIAQRALKPPRGNPLASYLP
jgi:hypothetical protein